MKALALAIAVVALIAAGAHDAAAQVFKPRGKPSTTATTPTPTAKPATKSTSTAKVATRKPSVRASASATTRTPPPRTAANSTRHTITAKGPTSHVAVSGRPNDLTPDPESAKNADDDDVVTVTDDD